VTIVYRSTVVNASADEVWELISDYNGLPSWLPGIESSEIRDGRPANEPGAVRVLQGAEGPPVLEILHEHSPEQRSMTYGFLEPTDGLASYRSTLSVRPVTDGDRAYIEWVGELEAAPGVDIGERVGFIGGVIYGGGLGALKERFGG
jgi:hypothetical protein